MAKTEEYKLRLVVESMVGNAIKEFTSAKTAVNLFNTSSTKMLGTLGKSVAKFGALGTAVFATTKTIKASITATNEFNESLASIATLIPDQVSRLNDLKGSLQELSVESGKSLDDLSDGLYQVISAFGDATDTEEKLDIVTKGAIAGQASTTASLDLLSAVTKAYGDTSAEALTKVSDLAFMTVKLGQTTYPELASSIQNVTAMSEMLGVSQEELFGVFSTLTGVTGSASEVSTQLRSALTGLASPSEDLIKLFDELGVVSGEQLVQQEGLQGAFEKIIEYSEETGTSLQSLVGRQQAMIAVQALGSAQAETYAQKFEQIQEASGATETAFEQVSDGIDKVGFALEQVSALNKVVLTQIGEKFNPVLGALADGYLSVLGKISGNITATDDLNTATESLLKSSTDYNAILTKLESNQDDLTAVERTLLEVRKEQASLNLATELKDLSSNYDDVSNKADKYTETIEKQKAKQLEAQEIVDEFISSGLADEINNATEGQLRQGNSLTELGKKANIYRQAQEDLINSTEEITETELKLKEINLESKSTMTQVAEAVRNGTLNIDSYKISNIELYDEIMNVVDALNQQKDIQETLDFSDEILQVMKKYNSLSSDELDILIEQTTYQKQHVASNEDKAYLEQLLVALSKQRLVTLNSENDIAESYLATAKATYESQLYELTLGEGLVKVENERAKAIEDAKENHVDDADLLNQINDYYDKQAELIRDELAEQAEYNLAIQTAKDEVEEIEIERQKALDALEEQGITTDLNTEKLKEQGKTDEEINEILEENKSIIDDTNALYDDQIDAIEDTARASAESSLAEWDAKTKALDVTSEAEQLELDRALAIAEVTAKYEGQEDVLDDIIAKINEYYDAVSDGNTEEEGHLSILEKLNEAFYSFVGSDGQEAIEGFQQDVADLQQLWSDLTPIISSVTDAISSYYDAQEQISEAEIDALEDAYDEKYDLYEDELDDLEDAYDDKLDALEDLYDSDAITYEEYMSRKADADSDYNDAVAEADNEAVDAYNAYLKAQYDADVSAFEYEKKSAKASAIIAGAQGIMQAWALGPIAGAIGSAVITGATAYQISQIESQTAPAEPSYITAFADGGIVTGPTTALIGEAGEDEMVLPLSKAQDMGFTGDGSKGDTYNISGNTFVGIDGVDELIIMMEKRKKVLEKRNKI